MEKLLEFVYEHLNQCYGFKRSLPGERKVQSNGVGTILLCLPAKKIPSPDMFYAVVKIQNPHGILDFFQWVSCRYIKNA